MQGTDAMAQQELDRLRQVEREFQKTEQRYRYFTEQTVEGFYRLDCVPPVPINLPVDELVARIYDSVVAECNDIFAKTYGMTARTMIGTTLATLHGGTSEPANLAHLRSFVGAGFRATGEETREYDDKGNLIYLENNSVGIVENGQLLGIWGTQRDITGAKQAEAERDALLKQLHHAQKMEAVGRIVGGVAHDFNNMLSVVRGRAELMMESLRPGDNQLRTDIREILLAVEKSTALIHQLLTFARKEVVEPRIVNLNELIAANRIFLLRLIGENIEVEIECAPELWPTRIAPSQADQILANLLVNARDAVGTCGSVTIETRNVSRHPYPHNPPQPDRTGDFVCLCISDSGAGMSDEQMEHLFEPFFTTKKTGTGLGLSTVYGIVQQNGGFITARSKVGLGTIFEIFLPRYEGPSDATARLPEPIGAAAFGTILVVDDENQVLSFCREALRRKGYQMLMANHPEEALRLCREYPGRIDLLLTDVIMPGINGPALSARLTSMRPNLKTIFMSGYTADELGPFGLGEGSATFIQKPFEIASLISRINNALATQNTGTQS
jgi:two-component system, cell cycle sensor histidine kinase and response regulator CckA